MILDALEEVLFWDSIPLLMNFTAENLKRYHPHDYEGYRLEKEKFLQKQIPTKDAFVRRLEYYLDKGKPLWVSGRSAQVDELTEADLERTFQIHLTAERAKQTAEKVEALALKDADFYGFYTDNALHTKENRVLDLTVGAGVGAVLLMRSMKPQDLYLGVDIDFKCAKNADSLASHYSVRGAGLPTSLWQLPIEDDVFTAVTCNQGLEECREIPTILSEAARVLKKGGRAVIRVRKQPHSVSLFESYGFSPEETAEWLTKLRLYSNADGIISTFKALGLSLMRRYDKDKLGSILVFIK